MDKKNIFVLEAGINHFGKIKEANEYLNYFLNSKFNYLTFMLQTETFYNKYKRKINFHLPNSFYEKAIKLSHKKNKKIGIAVCDLKTFKPLSNLNFDFYKLLGLSINNKDLINELRKKKKKVYISLSKGSNQKIKKCLNYFKNRNKLNLIYTSMSYDSADLNLKRINDLKKRFKLPVGYGHHYNNSFPLFLSLFHKPSFCFVYIKSFSKRNRKYPDDDHAFLTKDLNKLYNDIKEAKLILKNKKINTKIKFVERIKF
jgi:sialic acid synthase SpsE